MDIKLNQNYSLTAEPHLKGFRLMVLENGNVWVCRKETTKNLSRFLAQNEGHIFKGRLQLYKHHDTISVEVKGQKIGVVGVGYLQKQLLQVK